MLDDPLVPWAQRCAGLGAVLVGLTGVFLAMAFVSFARRDAWGSGEWRGREIDALPLLGGGLLTLTALALAITIFAFAYRLNAAPRAGCGVFLTAAVLSGALAAVLGLAPDLVFGTEGSITDRARAADIGLVLTLAATLSLALATVLTTRVLRRREA